MFLALAAVAGVSFALGLSVKRSNPASATAVPSLRRPEPVANIQAARPVVAPPEFAIEPAAPEQSPGSLPLTDSATKPATEAAAKGSTTRPEAPARSAPAPASVAATADNSVAAHAAPVAVPQNAEAPARAVSSTLAQAVPSEMPAETRTAGEEAEAVFDARAAESAINGAAQRAASCKQAGDPSGVAVVMITFSPSGRATTANIAGPPFAGTPTGGCIAATLRSARVPAFSGDFVTVKKTVKID
jgi:hypothetical protein